MKIDEVSYLCNKSVSINVTDTHIYKHRLYPRLGIQVVGRGGWGVKGALNHKVLSDKSRKTICEKIVGLIYDT